MDGFPVVLTLPVQWGEQDSFGHVNNLIYLRWFESGRIAYLERARLWTQAQKDYGPILASITCHFRRPVNYPDEIRVGTCVTRIGRTSMTVAHRAENRAGELVADGDSVVVWYDYQSAKPHPVSDEMRQVIARVEGRPL
ncbi:MAG: thioesterase family protein [Bryobacteraceae bacterium]|nr:thioesterase family protein [Bryobacteraceae bacterium]